MAFLMFIVSKAIIDKHGGFVGAYSKGEGCGTTFFFEMEIFHGSNQVLQADNIVQEGFGDLLEGESLASEEYQDLDPIVSNAKSPQMTERLLSSKTAMSTPSGVVGEESFSEVALKLQEKKFSLLLADDSILARKMVERLINNTKIFAGQPILHANNGKEAVDKVLDSINNGKPIDVVLIDYYMPGMSGPEAIKLLREQNFKGVIFALTASNSEDNTFKLAEAGADLILPKPFDVNLFSAKLAGKALHYFQHTLNWH